MDEYDDGQFDKRNILGEESGNQTSPSPPASRSIEPLGLAPVENMITQPTNGAGNNAVIARQSSAVGSRSNVFTIVRPAAVAQDFAQRFDFADICADDRTNCGMSGKELLVARITEVVAISRTSCKGE